MTGCQKNCGIPKFHIVSVNRTNNDAAFVLCLCQEVWETDDKVLCFPENTCSLHMREATACCLPRLKAHVTSLSPIAQYVSFPQETQDLVVCYVRVCENAHVRPLGRSPP